MKISERDKLLLMILGIVVVVALYGVFLLPQMLEEIETLNEEKGKLEQEVAEVNRLVNIKDDYKNLNAKFIPFQEKFLHKQEQKRILLTLDSLLLAANLKLEEMSFNDEKKDAKKMDPVLAELPCIEAEFTCTGNYDGFKQFMEQIESNNKKIVIKEVETEVTEVAGVVGLKCTVILQFYFSNLDLAVEEEPWELGKTAGGTNPFIKVGFANTHVSTSANNTLMEPYHLILIAKAFSKDYPTVMMGTGSDFLGENFVFADNEGMEDVQLRLFKKGNEYKYEYKTKQQSITGDILLASGVNNQIVLRIKSSPRKEAKDKSGVKLSLNNEIENIQLVVQVVNEDEESPRIDFVKQEGNILLQ